MHTCDVSTYGSVYAYISYIFTYICVSMSSNEEDFCDYQHSKLNKGISTRNIRIYLSQCEVTGIV